MAYYNGKKLPSVVMVHGKAEEPVLIEKTVTENGEYSAAADGADGYSKFTANVPVPEGYVIPDGDVEITENGTHDVSGKATATVNVAGGAELNIAYGDTAPTDTSKLWVSGAEPSKVSTAFNVSGEETFTANVGALPAQVFALGTAAVGKNIYLFGGLDPNLQRLSSIWRYDTETNSITTLSTNLPFAAAYIGTASVGKKIYLFGGDTKNYSDTLNTINCFDTETNTITTMSTSLPYRTSAVATAAVGGKIYLFGGAGDSNSSIRSEIYCYDTETNTINSVGSLPTPTKYISASAVGTKIYLFGGSTSSGNTSIIYCFDTVTGTLTTLSTSFSTKTKEMCSVTFGTKVYLFGGSNFNKAIQCFNSTEETITTLPINLPTNAISIGGANVGTNIYLFGGNPNSSAINLFSVAFDLPTDNLLLHLSATENYFNLINTDKATIEVGVQGVYRGNADGVGELETAYLHNGTDWVEV